MVEVEVGLEWWPDTGPLSALQHCSASSIDVIMCDLLMAQVQTQQGEQFGVVDVAIDCYIRLA